ncbi:unnamed protein product [Toxocara canis]|uniref:Uncharacterized protein n=1 Tax=Toxocara canis TaxID=6265 RepID=A0A183TWR9_TOXCA|nr:unnamed protein product [Toxocara canis]
MCLFAFILRKVRLAHVYRIDPCMSSYREQAHRTGTGHWARVYAPINNILKMCMHRYAARLDRRYGRSCDLNDRPRSILEDPRTCENPIAQNIEIHDQLHDIIIRCTVTPDKEYVLFHSSVQIGEPIVSVLG